MKTHRCTFDRVCSFLAVACILLGCRGAKKNDSLHLTEATPEVHYFSNSFVASRDSFVRAVERLRSQLNGVTHEELRLPGWQADPDLATDVVLVPGKSNDPHQERRLLVITSAIHGIEGYAGSAVQRLFLNEQAAAVSSLGIDVLLVHGINAHGFKGKVRYSEDRVDLNRTWFVGDTFPKDLEDGGYTELNGLFNPSSAAAFGTLDFDWFVVSQLMPRLGDIRSGRLTKAAGIGQYKYPKGIIYGGSDFSPHRNELLKILTPHLKKYKKVMGWDLHTGLGKRQMQLLPNPPYNTAIDQARSKVFESSGRSIEASGNTIFYASHGDFSDFLCQFHQELRSDGQCASMLLEFGTLLVADWEARPALANVRDIAKQAYTLYVNIRENQMYHFGARKESDRVQMRRAYEELFYPEDVQWRSMVIDESRLLLPKFTEAFSEF